MLSRSRRQHVGNSAGKLQGETDLLWNMDVGFRGWGSKEESTVVDKEVSELSVSERKCTEIPSTSSNIAGSNSRPGTSSDVSARPRFCHNVCCSMLGKPVYQAIHVVGCCVCSKKILKAKPSDNWQHLLEPECGPALHTASWRMSPALPAPSLGCGYGAGRKVSVDRCRVSTAQDEYMGSQHSQDESQLARRSPVSPAARKLETDEIVKRHRQSNQICYDPVAKCTATTDTTAHSDSNAPIASKLVMPDMTSDEDDQKDVSSQAADTRQQEVFDKYSDENSSGIHDVSEEQPTPEESMSTWRMQSQSIFRGFSGAEIELQTTEAATGIDTYIENAKSEYLMSLNGCLGPTWRRSKSSDARVAPADTDNLKTLGTCRLLSSRLPLHMSGVSSPSTGNLIDSKVPMQGMRASSMKPDCSDSLLLYRKAQRDLRTASSSSMAETVAQDMQSEDLAFPHDDDVLHHSTSTEHRWGSGGQAMTRNKRISKVVRPQSTPPVMPSLISASVVDKIAGSHEYHTKIKEGHKGHLSLGRISDVSDKNVTFDQLHSVDPTQHSEPSSSAEDFYTSRGVDTTDVVQIHSPELNAIPQTASKRSRRNAGKGNSFAASSLFINERPFSSSSSSRQWPAASPGTSSSLDLKSNPNRRSPRRAHSSLESCARQGKEECEIFGGHFERDPETKRGICVGVAAHHAPDYHRSYSFETSLGRSARRPGRTNKIINEAGYDDVFTGSASPVDAPVFSRPCSRQLDRPREDASRQLADVILIGREKSLLEERPESPAERGAKVKPRPAAGYGTVERELAKRLSKRHEAKASKERKHLTKSKVPAAIYLDGKFSTTSPATSSPQEYQYLDIQKNSEERCLGGGEEIIIDEEGTAMEKSDVFPSTSQSRHEQVVAESGRSAAEGGELGNVKKLLDDAAGWGWAPSNSEKASVDVVSEEEEEEEVVQLPRVGPVMQFLGENESHPVHLVKQLQHQAKACKETTFCSEVLNRTRELKVPQVEHRKWARRMVATVQHAQALLAPTFYGRLPHTINGDDPVQALRDKSNFQREAEKLFAMNPQNLSDVSKGLERKKYKRVLFYWLTAAESARTERIMLANLIPQSPPIPRVSQEPWGRSSVTKSAQKGGKPVREMSKREQVEALLTLYQQREVPILRGKLTSMAF